MRLPRGRARIALLLFGASVAIGWQLRDAVPSPWHSTPTPVACATVPILQHASTSAPSRTFGPPHAAAPQRRAGPAASPAPESVAAQRQMFHAEFVAANSATTPPSPAPSSLGNRFREETVFDALTAGLDEVGSGVTIDRVDCSELPCLFFGAGFGTAEEASWLRASDALHDYRDATTAVFGWLEPGPDGGQVQRFAVAVYPPPAAAGDETFRRLGARVRAGRDDVAHER